MRASSPGCSTRAGSKLERARRAARQSGAVIAAEGRRHGDRRARRTRRDQRERAAGAGDGGHRAMCSPGSCSGCWRRACRPSRPPPRRSGCTARRRRRFGAGLVAEDLIETLPCGARRARGLKAPRVGDRQQPPRLIGTACSSDDRSRPDRLFRGRVRPHAGQSAQRLARDRQLGARRADRARRAPICPSDDAEPAAPADAELPRRRAAARSRARARAAELGRTYLALNPAGRERFLRLLADGIRCRPRRDRRAAAPLLAAAETRPSAPPPSAPCAPRWSRRASTCCASSTRCPKGSSSSSTAAPS